MVYFCCALHCIFWDKNHVWARAQESSNFRMCAQTPSKTGGKNSGDCFPTDKEQSSGLEGNCMWLGESFWHRNMLWFANKTSTSSLSDSWLWIYSVNIIHILSIQNTSLNWNIYKFLPHPITLKNITGASELKICIVILTNSNPSLIQNLPAL